MVRALVLTLTFVTACYSAPEPACGFFCGPNGECPSNYTCFGDHRCHRNHSAADSCPDASIDAPYIGFDAIDYDADTTRPDFVSVTPAPGATNVPVTTVVSVTFTEPVINVTAGTFTAMNGSTNYAGAIATSDQVTWTFTPTNDWPAGTMISMSLSSGISDYAGNPFLTYGWTFTTQ